MANQGVPGNTVQGRTTTHFFIVRSKDTFSIFSQAFKLSFLV
jgi:hypothetical protein